jgi:hypothetical protein
MDKADQSRTPEEKVDLIIELSELKSKIESFIDSIYGSEEKSAMQLRFNIPITVTRLWPF